MAPCAFQARLNDQCCDVYLLVTAVCLCVYVPVRHTKKQCLTSLVLSVMDFYNDWFRSVLGHFPSFPVNFYEKMRRIAVLYQVVRKLIVVCFCFEATAKKFSTPIVDEKKRSENNASQT